MTSVSREGGRRLLAAGTAACLTADVHLTPATMLLCHRRLCIAITIPSITHLLLCSVLQLDLRGNSLGNDGAIIISRGLRSAESKLLAELDMGYNEIKDDGACALAQVRSQVWQ